MRRGLPTAVYTAEMFGTGHDEANRAVVRAVPGAQLDLVGLAVHGPRNAVDKTCAVRRCIADPATTYPWLVSATRLLVLGIGPRPAEHPAPVEARDQ